MKFRSWLFPIIALMVLSFTACGGGGGGSGDSAVSADSTADSTDSAVSADEGGTTSSPVPTQDTVAPIVIATNPIHNASAVDLNRIITATFSEDVSPGTLTPQSCLLVEDENGDTLEVDITYDAGSRTVSLRNANLLAGSGYKVTLTSSIKDIAGNPLKTNYDWHFTTSGTYTPPLPPSGGTLDVTPPQVRSTSPAANALNVPVEIALVVTFSEGIDANTVNAQTFTLKKNGTTAVTGSVTYTGTSALFQPTADLEAGASYTATLTTGIKDLAGNSLPASFSWVFATTAQSDLTPPRVLSVSPSDGSQNVPVDSVIVVTFNEPIKPFSFGLLAGRPVLVTFNDSYTTVTLQPTADLSAGLTYNASIQAADMAGNLSEVFSWRFTTSP